jgi:hypothetical protein
MDYADPIAQALSLHEFDSPLLFEGELDYTNAPEQFVRRGLSAAPMAVDCAESIPLDSVESLMLSEALAYLAIDNPGYPLIFGLPAGAGKTRFAVRLAERLAAASKRVLYVGPRRDFYQDVLNESTQPSWWYPWQPRHHGDLEAIPIIQPTCKWAIQMNEWLARGYNAIDFCSNPRICGWKYISNGCPYHGQKKRTEPIIFGQHAHVALGHPLMSSFSVVIGDELPLSAFLHPWRIPIKHIVPKEIQDSDIDTLLRNIRFLAENLPDRKPGDESAYWQGQELYEALPGGARSVVTLLEGHSQLLAGLVPPPDLRVAESVTEAPYNHLIPLLNLLLREARRIVTGHEIIPRLRLDESGMIIRMRRGSANLPNHVIWLDATGDTAIYGALFDMFPSPPKIINPSIKTQGRIYQLWHSTNNRRSLLSEPKTEAITAQIRYIIKKHGYQKPATISYKQIGDSLLPGAASLHFGAARGTNRLIACDALFVVGAPLPSHEELKNTAAMLHDKRDTPWIGKWHARDVPFAGTDRAYTVGNFWDDPDLSALVRQMREAELVQAIHRVRPLRRQVDIWLLTNIVTNQPVILVSLHELIGAIESDGTPIQGIDLPAFMALDSLDEPITSSLIMEQFGVTRATAIKWIEAILLTGRYEIVRIPVAGTKPIKGIVKIKKVSS